MDKRRPQLDLVHSEGLETLLTKFLIVVVGCSTGGKECGGNFSPSEIGNVLACSSRTKGAMDKRIRQLDSARRIGLETTLTDFLIIVVKLRLLVVEINWAEFLKIGNLEMFLPTVL